LQHHALLRALRLHRSYVESRHRRKAYRSRGARG
jgi:hypothetical protein